MSYTCLLYHIIFRTKNSVPAITEQYENLLYQYMWGFIKENNSILYRINGMPDHLHLFVEIHQGIDIAKFVGKLKRMSHLFLDEHKDKFPNFSAWSVGYCALTYSAKDKAKIINYIKNQKEHHRRTDFDTEMKDILADIGIEYDETYFDKHI